MLQVCKARQSVYHRKTDWLLPQYNANQTCGFNWHLSFKLLDEHSFLRNVIILGRYQPPCLYYWSKHNNRLRIMHTLITNHIISLTSLNCCCSCVTVNHSFADTIKVNKKCCTLNPTCWKQNKCLRQDLQTFSYSCCLEDIKTCKLSTLNAYITAKSELVNIWEYTSMALKICTKCHKNNFDFLRGL